MSMLRLIGGIAYVAVLYVAALFLPAGTLHWLRAWVLLGLTVVSTTISTIYLSATSPDVVKERWKPPIQRGQPLADKILLACSFCFTPALSSSHPWMSSDGNCFQSLEP